MQLGRRSILSRSLFAIVLLAILVFQVEPVFACEWMDGRMQSHCCCDDRRMAMCDTGDGCATRSAGCGPCCKVSYRVTAQSATDDALAVDDLALVYAPLPLPVVWFAATLIDFLPIEPPFGGYPKIRIAWIDGTETYLITRRFRD